MSEATYPVNIEAPDITPYREGNTGIDYVTTLDSGTRLLRYNLEELGSHFRPLGLITRHRIAAGGLAVLAIGYFAVMKVGGKPAGITLWALFGITNQLLGALGFLVMTLWFYKAGRPFLYLLLPMLFMTKPIPLRNG